MKNPNPAAPQTRMVRIMRTIVVVVLFAVLTFSQSMPFPPAGDPWWQTDLGKHWTAYAETEELCEKHSTLDSFYSCLVHEGWSHGDPYIGKVLSSQPDQILDNMPCEG